MRKAFRAEPKADGLSPNYIERVLGMALRPGQSETLTSARELVELGANPLFALARAATWQTVGAEAVN